jgi:DNA gyrase subunit A
MGRNTQGVTLIKLAPSEKLVGLERVQEPSELEEGDVIEVVGELDEGAPALSDEDIVDGGDETPAADNRDQE